MTITPTVLIWAVGFANPLILYGLAAASLPILIHLLNRRRFREVSWAAMRFLAAALNKNSRRIRIEHWLLLAVRTLVVIFAVMAMARPYLESFGNIIAGRRTHRVLVIDGSLSMGYSSRGTSRFDQAKSLASQLVKDSHHGDAISVVLMAGPPRVVIGDPSPNLEAVNREISELAQTQGAVDLVATFEAVDRVLDVSPIDQKEIVFVTDLQATNWRGAASQSSEGWKKILAKLEERRVRSVVIDLGRAREENRSVTDIGLEAPVATVGANARIRAVIKNFGTVKVDGLRARLTIDGRLGPEETRDLGPDEEAAVFFTHQFAEPGDHVLGVKIDDDPLALDNERSLVVPVLESLKVLLVDGHYKAEAYESETDYLVEALNPTETSPGTTSSIQPNVVPESQFLRQDLSKFDVVILCNVAQFSQPETKALEQFLQRGGGIVFFGGDQVVAENHNRLLYADGKGILPAAIGESKRDAARKESVFTFNPLGYKHPIVADFRGQSDAILAGLTQSLVFQYQRLEIPKGSNAQIAMAFDTGDPAIIEAPRYRGKVIQVATSADSGWTSWPVHNSYPPIMLQIVLQAAAGVISERNIRVGQPFDQHFSDRVATTEAIVVNPKGVSLTAKLQTSGDESRLHFEQTELAGRYIVRMEENPPSETSFATNPDPLESDLRKLEKADLEAVAPGWNFLYLTNWRELTESAASVGRRGEFHRPFLVGLLTLLLLESFLAWKFGHHSNS